jgi:hypothetical protein
MRAVSCVQRLYISVLSEGTGRGEVKVPLATAVTRQKEPAVLLLQQ